MPKVLRIINRFNLGGPTYNVTFLTQFLSDEFETLLIGGVPDKGELDSNHILDKYGVKPVIIEELEREISIKKDKIALKKIRKIIREFKPDIVHTHASKAGAIGRWAAIQENVPVILHTFHGHVFHSYFGKTKTQFYKTVERQLAKRTSGIIAISNQQKKELTNTYKIAPPEKCHVVKLGFDLERFTIDIEKYRNSMRQKYALEENTVAIGIIGRLTEIKDHNFFLESIEVILKNKNLPKIKVFIIGDGILKEALELKVQQIEKDNSCFNTFIFTSWVTQLEDIIHGLDIVALSSKNEGTPVSIIEGMACKKAVISTDVGGVRDLITPNISGVIVPVNNKKKYIEGLENLISNSELRKEFGEKGKTFAFSNYHYTRLTKDIAELYKQLLNTTTPQK